jgi:hypothetical protein
LDICAKSPKPSTWAEILDEKCTMFSVATKLVEQNFWNIQSKYIVYTLLPD